MRVAIVGTGIAGNVAARELHAEGHEVTVFEAGAHVGGHTHTHEIELDGAQVRVDSGFIVFNRRTYPLFCRLLESLGVASQESSMSFSVRCDSTGLEYNGTNLDGLFAQRRNLLRPSFLGMVADILRFNREAPRLLDRRGGEQTLGSFLDEHRYGRAFREHYLIPMGAAIWSTAPARMLEFPARFFVRFLHNHGMLSVNDRPVWRTVTGGSARYVERLVAPFRDHIWLRTPVAAIRRTAGGVLVRPEGQAATRFDAVFLACHSDQALRMLEDPTPAERAVLGAIPYRANEAVLHTDARWMPRSRRAWAAWNYHRSDEARADAPATLTYNMNILQRLETRRPLMVTLNGGDRIDPASVLRRMTYHHPLFTPGAVAAQARQGELNRNGTYYCGAYWRFGFHEDGVWSAHEALRHFRERGSHPVRRVA